MNLNPWGTTVGIQALLLIMSISSSSCSNETVQTTGRLQGIDQARIVPVPDNLTNDWQLIHGRDWEYFNYTSLWNLTSNHTWTNPGVFYTPVYGSIIAERGSFQETFYKDGKFWHSPIDLERNCLCTRKVAQISPKLSVNLLRQVTVISRPPGSLNRYQWFWEQRDRKSQPVDNYLYPMTLYRYMTMDLLTKYVTVRATCVHNSSGDLIVNNTPSVLQHNVVLLDTHYFKLAIQDPRKHAWLPMRRRYIVQCQFTGETFAPELATLDLIIQEIDPDLKGPKTTRALTLIPVGYTHVMSHTYIKPFTSWKRWSRSTIIWPSHAPPFLKNPILKWILPTHDPAQYRDGPAQLFPGPVELYQTYPSYVLNDELCQQRLQSNLSCRHPVAGMAIKLLFFNHVLLDPSNGRKQFPLIPIKIVGDLSHDKHKFPAFKHRKKRLAGVIALGVTALIFGLLGTAGSIYAGVSSHTMKDAFKTEIDALNLKYSQRFTQIEENMLIMAQAIKSNSRSLKTQGEAIGEIMRIMIGRNFEQHVLDEYQSNRISKIERTLLNHITRDVSYMETIQRLTVTELKLHELVMQHLQNASGIKMFEKSKMYLMQLRGGAIAIKEHAQNMLAVREELALNNSQLDEESRAIRNLVRTLDEQAEDRLSALTILINNTEVFNASSLTIFHENYTIDWTRFDNATAFSSTMQKLADGLNDAATDVWDWATDNFNGLGGILSKMLWPLLTGLMCVIIGFVLLKLVLKFVHNKRNMTSLVSLDMNSLKKELTRLTDSDPHL